LPERQSNGLEIVGPIFPDTHEIDPRISSVANPLGLPALIFFVQSSGAFSPNIHCNHPAQ